MVLKEKQQKAYEEFYESTHSNDALDTRTELLIGLAAAIALNCEPCTAYYLKKLQIDGASKIEIKETVAKVMAVSAGQKKLQTQRTIEDFKINMNKFA